MGVAIKLTIATIEFKGELNDSVTAEKLAELLPLRFGMSRWGEEYYGDAGAPLDCELESGARDVMEVGELAYWPPGNAICIFWGPTPVSQAGEPRAASDVNPIGKVEGDFESLKNGGPSIHAKLELA